jgi:hypothetical protein
VLVAEMAHRWIEHLDPTVLPGTLGLTSEMRLIFRTLSVIVMSVGFVVIGVGAFFLKRPGDRAFGDPAIFYVSVHHYDSVASIGVLIGLAGCRTCTGDRSHKRIPSGTKLRPYRRRNPNMWAVSISGS